MTAAELQATGLRLRMTLRRASSPLEADTLRAAVEALRAIASNRARGLA